MNRQWPFLLVNAVLLMSAAGCATFWEEAMSRERDWAYITGYGKPSPLVVLRDNKTDGWRRAQALSELREPLRHGGNAQDQEAYLTVLERSAKEDAEPICRLSAIRALGKFRDPRAARILEEVYYQQQGKITPDNKAIRFTPENNSLIRKEVLVALENTRDEKALEFLVRVARQPGPPFNASLADSQQTQDEKLVAIRALGKYRHTESADALAYVLKTEKDIALRDRALQSLEEVSGKKWPSSYEAWQKEDVAPTRASQDNNIIQRVGGWLPKF